MACEEEEQGGNSSTQKREAKQGDACRRDNYKTKCTTSVCCLRLETIDGRTKMVYEKNSTINHAMITFKLKALRPALN